MSEAPKPIGRIEAPLVNPNEPESQVVELSVRPYSPIAKGDAVCTVETSKATFLVLSEHDGFVGDVLVALGEHVVAGQLICEVFDRLPEPGRATAGGRETGRPPGLKLTKKAERLALERAYQDHLKTYETDRVAAARLIHVGASQPPIDVDICELAAWTVIANTLLNLDETITKG